MDIAIRIATTEEEKEAIYRLRYEIYVDEMHIFGAQADHDRRRLVGPHDATARLMYATLDGEVVATLRLNFGVDAPFSGEFEQTYRPARFRPAISDSQMLILTRFMVRRDLRGSTLAFRMIAEVARLALAEGVEVALCDCQPHLIRYYHRIGFRSYECPVYNDQEFGIMVPLAFVMRDVEHLRTIRSPLRSLFEAQAAPPDATVQHVLACLGWPAARDAQQAEAAGAMAHLLCRHADGQAPLFDGLSAADVHEVAAQGYVIECAAGDRVIRAGQTARTVFVLVSGALDVQGAETTLAVTTPGEVVGELSFLLDERRLADVYAGPDGACVLCLDEQQLQRQLRASSRASAALALNLSRALARKLAATMVHRHVTRPRPARPRAA